MKTEDLLEITVDKTFDPMFGTEQMYNTFPVTFPVVAVALEPSNVLYKALIWENPEIDAAEDFDFRIHLIDIFGGAPALAPSIEAMGCESGTWESISLTDRQADMLFPLISAQCLRAYGKSAADLLSACRKEYHLD